MTVPRRDVSVVIPCHNASPFLRETIESIQRQTMQPVEILLVDDCSTDDSAEVGASLGVSVIRHDKNRGECAARNSGIEAARGAWVAFVDADDLWQPSKLERQMEAALVHPDTVCVHTGYFLFGATQDEPPTPQAVLDRRYDVETLIVEPLINSSTAMVRRGLPTAFPEGVSQAGDMIFFAELSLLGGFAYVPERLAGYRMHPAQVTRRAGAATMNLDNRFKWVAAQEDRLGSARARVARAGLRRQLVTWLDIARWNRLWPRYWELRQYGLQLDWEGDPQPTQLRERILPQWTYEVKDRVDNLLGLGTHARTAGGSQ